MRYPQFRSAIETILGTWSALKLAIENGQGGSQGKDIAHWMVGTLEDFFDENDNLLGEEVADFLEEIMDQELDTVVEDHSLEDVGEQLTEYFRMCVNNKESELRSILEKLNLAAANSNISSSVQLENASDSSDEDMDTDDVSPPEEVNSESGPSAGTSRRSGQMHVTQPDDDGWVTVSKSKPR